MTHTAVALFANPWPPSKRGPYRVALYKADWNKKSPVCYEPHSFTDHRSLKAAARRLAHLIAAQHRRGYRGERLDALLIILPDGETIALREAQRRIKADE